MSEILRVVHLASGDLWAGAEVQLFQLCLAMQKVDDVELHVVLLNEGKLAERLREQAVPVSVFDESTLSGFSILRHLITEFRQRRPHIVHTHRQKENVLGSIAARLAGVPRSVRTVHGAPEFANTGIKRRVNRLLDSLTASWLQHSLIMVTEDLAQQLTGTYPSNKVRVIENGLLPVHERPVGEPDFAVPGKINVCFAGRLVPVKRIDVFLDIAKSAIDASDERFVFHVFGDGPLSDAVSQQIADDQLEPVVKRWGFVDGLNDALLEMQVLVMTSNHEGLPMVMLEAMARRTPILAHAVGGMPEVLAHGESGVLVDEHSGQAFYAALTELTDDARRSALADKAYARFLKRYTAEACAQRTVDLYRQTLASR